MTSNTKRLSRDDAALCAHLRDAAKVFITPRYVEAVGTFGTYVRITRPGGEVDSNLKTGSPPFNVLHELARDALIQAREIRRGSVWDRFTLEQRLAIAVAAYGCKRAADLAGRPWRLLDDDDRRILWSYRLHAQIAA